MISRGALADVSRPSRGFFESKWRLATESRFVGQFSRAITVPPGSYLRAEEPVGPLGSSIRNLLYFMENHSGVKLFAVTRYDPPRAFTSLAGAPQHL